MCLWLLTACLGLMPSSPSTNVVVQVPVSIPNPILIPTAATNTTAMTNFPGPPTYASTVPPGATSPPATNNPPPGSNNPPPGSNNPPPGSNNPPPANTALPTAPPFSSIGPALLPVMLCNNPDIVCIINPDDDDTGPPQIDPRLGTTPSASAALQNPPIIGYSAQVPNYDNSVRFPRQKRNVVNEASVYIKDFLKKVSMKDSNHKRSKRQSCSCVPAGTCPTSTNSGAGMIDIRIVTPGGSQCPVGQVYCCTGNSMVTVQCGTLQAVPAVAVTPSAGQANFGEYPWQALILTKQNDYIAGGVLIDQLNVLTVTHRMTPYIVSGTAPNVKVRLGEWDAGGTYEPVPNQEYTVSRVFTHPSYNAATLQYDITVLRLSSRVPLTSQPGAAVTINRACLPPSSSSVYTGMRCYVSGWGKNMFGIQGQYQQILKKTDVPIVASGTCQSQLQAARLGASYVLDTTSFICAGGEANKDACTGDGGSGLVCQMNGQWTVVGLVAWGLGCAMANVPAAYVNIAALLPWIQQQVATSY